VSLPAHELFLANATPESVLTVIRDPESMETIENKALAPTESFAEKLASLTRKPIPLATSGTASHN
jgi:hypothetical protein